MSKLEKLLISDINLNKIYSIKLILRSFAVLASADCIHMFNDGFISVLNILLNFINDSNVITFDKPVETSFLTDELQIVLYLLSTVIPWVLKLLIDTSEGT